VNEGEFPGYETVEEIKGGGMARCFKVPSRASGELLFLKCVGGGSQDADALQREIDIYSRLTQVDNHEHLLDVRDLVRSNGQVALVTEFADGGDLKRFLDEAGGKGLPPREALPVALEIASGLGALHEANIVHRDLKPENVLRAGSRWKLADFGIAKSRSRAAPGVTFQQAGTYGYAAPEQFEGVPADPSADIYSFGKILTYLLTGSTDPDKIRVEYSDLRRLVQRCVQYLPTSRPTVDEVGTTLKEVTGR
jgi:serine/threonine protein kinase